MGNVLEKSEVPDVSDFKEYAFRFNNTRGFEMLIGEDLSVLSYTKSTILFSNPDTEPELSKVLDISSLFQPYFNRNSKEILRLLVDDFVKLMERENELELGINVPSVVQTLVGNKGSLNFVWSFLPIDSRNSPPTFFFVKVPVAARVPDGKYVFYMTAVPYHIARGLALERRLNEVGMEIEEIIEHVQEAQEAMEENRKRWDEQQIKEIEEKKKELEKEEKEIQEIRDKIASVRKEMTDNMSSLDKGVLDSKILLKDMENCKKIIGDICTVGVPALTYHDLERINSVISRFLTSSAARYDSVRMELGARILRTLKKKDRIKFELKKLRQRSYNGLHNKLRMIEHKIENAKVRNRELNDEVKALTRELAECRQLFEERSVLVKRLKWEVEMNERYTKYKTYIQVKMTLLSRITVIQKFIKNRDKMFTEAYEEMIYKTQAKVDELFRANKALRVKIYSMEPDSSELQKAVEIESATFEFSHAEYQQFVRSIAESTQRLQIVVNKDKIIVASSKLARELFDEDLVGLPLTILFPETQPYSDDNNEAIYKKIVNATFASPSDRYVLMKTSTGEPIWVRITKVEAIRVGNVRIAVAFEFEEVDDPEAIARLKKKIHHQRLKIASMATGIERIQNLIKESNEALSNNKEYINIQGESMEYDLANAELRDRVSILKGQIQDEQNREKESEAFFRDQVANYEAMKAELGRTIKEMNQNRQAKDAAMARNLEDNACRIEMEDAEKELIGDEIALIEKKIKRQKRLNEIKRMKYERLKKEALAATEYSELVKRPEELRKETERIMNSLKNATNEEDELSRKLEEVRFKLMQATRKNSQLRMEIENLGKMNLDSVSDHEPFIDSEDGLLHSKSHTIFNLDWMDEGEGDNRDIFQKLEQYKKENASFDPSNEEMEKILDHFIFNDTFRMYFIEYLFNQFHPGLLVFFYNLFGLLNYAENYADIDDPAARARIAAWKNAIYRWFLREKSIFELVSLDPDEAKQLSETFMSSESVREFYTSDIVVKLRSKLWGELLKFVWSILYRVLKESPQEVSVGVIEMHIAHYSMAIMEGSDGFNFEKQRSRLVSTSLNNSHFITKMSRPAVDISIDMIHLINELVKENYQVFNLEINSTRMYNSLAYKNFVVLTMELQNVSLKTLQHLPISHQKAFWINLHNSLTFHSLVEKGFETYRQDITLFERGAYGSSYVVGGAVLTIQRIRHILALHSNRKVLSVRLSLMKKYKMGLGDYYQISGNDPRIVFALFVMNAEPPFIKVVKPETIDKDLDSLTKRFLSRYTVVDHSKKQITFPKLVTRFRGSIAVNDRELVDFVASVLGWKKSVKKYRVKFSKVSNVMLREFEFEDTAQVSYD